MEQAFAEKKASQLKIDTTQVVFGVLRLMMLKGLFIPTQDLHQSSALIRDHPEVLGFYSLNHTWTSELSPTTNR